MSYLSICTTFYCHGQILDRYSCYPVDWEIREGMIGTDVETILWQGGEAFSEATPHTLHCVQQRDVIQ
jgi:hypothetical protein